ncbi:MAG: hypothetical protein OQK35_03225 [Alphaproteobacteria bacterium]|nr:hypothetical protein [Rhodospirillales bacterium]MCW9045323.1 hypothetical protein [Alphaproteobacteria bacterium]
MHNITTPSQIAWNYLRRNQDYQQESGFLKADQLIDAKPNLFSLTDQTHEDFAARKWGLLAYANPHLQELPFWHPDICLNTLTAETYTATIRSNTQPFIQKLRKAKADVNGLQLLNGQLCLNIASKSNSSRLMFPPGTLINETATIRFILPFGSDLPQQTAMITTLLDISNGKAKKMSTLSAQAW